MVEVANLIRSTRCKSYDVTTPKRPRRMQKGKKESTRLEEVPEASDIQKKKIARGDVWSKFEN